MNHKEGGNGAGIMTYGRVFFFFLLLLWSYEKKKKMIMAKYIINLYS